MCLAQDLGLDAGSEAVLHIFILKNLFWTVELVKPRPQWGGQSERKDGEGPWWAKISVTLRWGMLVIEVPLGWTGDLEGVKSAEVFCVKLPWERRFQQVKAHSSRYALPPLTGPLWLPLITFLMPHAAFLQTNIYFTVQLPVGRLNLPFVLSP